MRITTVAISYSSACHTLVLSIVNAQSIVNVLKAKGGINDSKEPRMNLNLDCLVWQDTTETDRALQFVLARIPLVIINNNKPYKTNIVIDFYQ